MTKSAKIIFKAVLLIIPVAALFAYRFAFDFDGLFGQDAYAYFDRARVLSGSDAVLPYFWPDGYPMAGALFGNILELSLAMQLVCALSIGLSAILLIRSYELRTESAAGITQYVIGVVFLTLCPLIIKHSVVIMSDALALLTVSSVIYVTSRSVNWSRLIFLVCIVIAAFMVRFPTIVITLPLFIAWLWKHRVGAVNYLGILVALGGIVWYWQSFDHSGLYESAASSWSVSNIFSSEFNGEQGRLTYALPNIGYVLGIFWNPKFGFIGLFLLYALIKERSIKHPFLLGSLFIYLVFIAGVPVQNERFLLLGLPILVVVSFESVKLMERTMIAGVVLVGVANIGVGHYIMQHPVNRNRLERNLADMLSGIKSDAVYTFDVDVALKVRQPEKVYYNLWEKEYDYMMPADILLIQDSWTEGQWKGTNVSKNIKRLKESEMRLIRELEGGWKLYQ